MALASRVHERDPEENGETMLAHHQPRLKLRIAASDAAVIAVVWTLTLWFGPHNWQRNRVNSLALVALIVALALVAIRQVGLLLSRRCTVRAVEMRLITKVVAFTVASMLLVDRIVLQDRGLRFYVSEGLVGGFAMLLCLTIERGVWRSLLRASRQSGLRERRVILLGSNGDAKRLVELFRVHPEHGIKVMGVVGSRLEAERNALGHMWLGSLDQCDDLIDALSLSGVVVAASPAEHEFVGDVVRRLVRNGVHVHLSTGVTGVDVTRFRHLPMAREPLLYVEHRKLGVSDQVAKRALDLVGSALLLVVLSPLMLAIAAAIKLDDRGPIFYTQVRGGRAGRRFKVIKFRTMRVNADQELAKLKELNERDGALFKMENDPRVTRIGKALRLSSLDELPQLFNVLVGQMSLVGPRPALPAEIDLFDEQLRTRETVRPGITGLWQVEARDSPSMDAYKRLDLFYVENWSLMGDLAIMVDTIEHMLGRVYRAVRRLPTLPAPTESIVPVPAATADTGIAKTA